MTTPTSRSRVQNPPGCGARVATVSFAQSPSRQRPPTTSARCLRLLLSRPCSRRVKTKGWTACGRPKPTDGAPTPTSPLDRAGAVLAKEKDVPPTRPLRPACPLGRMLGISARVLQPGRRQRKALRPFPVRSLPTRSPRLADRPRRSRPRLSGSRHRPNASLAMLDRRSRRVGPG
jgi:hypothetical protein